MSYEQYGTFRDFVRFVQEQSPEREIDNSEGWRGCAVGDYLREAVNGQKLIDTFDAGQWFRSVCPTGSLRSIMNNPHKCPNTYGELAELLYRYI